MKLIFTAFTLSCAIPGGIFTPTFTAGAVFGQLYVSTLIRTLAFFGVNDYVQYRGVYSILGAAAFTGSVTRTTSVAMIVLELNGHLGHAVPTMVCVLASYATSELIKTESFFEMLSDISGLDQKIATKGNIRIRDVLKTNKEYTDNIDYLSLEDSTFDDLIRIVRKHGFKKASQQDKKSMAAE